MNEIHVGWLNLHPEACGFFSSWDQNFIKRTLEGRIWAPVGDYDIHIHNDLDFEADGAVVLIAGRFHLNDADQINADLAKFRWVLFIVTSDEESLFPFQKIQHPNLQFYISTPRVMVRYPEGFRVIGDLVPPGSYAYLPQNEEDATRRELDWFFSGQVSNSRREQCVSALRRLPNGALFETAGFTQGPPERPEYYRLMANSKIVPCPSGPATQDTFRFFEALEAGCIPLADNLTPQTPDANSGYWYRFFGDDVPFPIIHDWNVLDELVPSLLEHWPGNANDIYAYWQNWKRTFVYNLVGDIERLSGVPRSRDTLTDQITVLVPVSPIPSHPSSHILEQTLASIREQLPCCEILVLFDGVRTEQEHRRADYEEFTRRMLWKINHNMHNVLPIIFDEHMHQSGMTRVALDSYVNTPNILFVESDTPLRGEIDWVGILKAIDVGYANVVRFFHETMLQAPHAHLMLDVAPQVIEGVELTKTAQYSQRPHLASTTYYRRIMADYFPLNARTFIEDRMYGELENAWLSRGKDGWNDHRVTIYTPPGNIQRSIHLDGRADEIKYEMTFGS